MNNDEKKAGAAPKNDITADELLVLLNKSVERSAASNGASQNREKNDGRKDAAPRRTADGALAIDDSVYRVAEDKLHKADALTSSDDSDLDIDALMEKFINQPRRDREIAAAEAAAEVEAEALSADIEAADEADDLLEEVTEDTIELDAEPNATEVAEVPADETEAEEAPVMDIDGIMTEAPTEEEAWADEGVNIPDALETEDAATAEYVAGEYIEESDAEEVFEETFTLDETANEETADNAPCVEAEAAEVIAEEFGEEHDPRKTAEFDISLIKKAADEDLSEVDRLVDEAFDHSETEVFNAVSDETAEDEIPEQVYGENDDDEVDQTDLNLMLAFGMEEELKDTVGEEMAGEIEDDIIRKHEETAQMQAVADKIEFTDYAQTEEIFNGYKSKYYALIVRMAAALALLLGLFLVENFSLIGLNVPHFMKPSAYPVVYAMVDLQLIVLCGALVFEQLVVGVKNIIALKPSPESITVFAVIVSALYTLVAGFIAPVEGFGLFNLPIAFAVLAALVYEFLNLKREVLSFNVVSTKRKKFVVTPVSDATESLEREVFKDFLPADSKIVRVGKTEFVDGFFARSEGDSGFKPIIGIMIPIVIILSALFMIVAFIATGSVYKALTSAFVTTVLTLPITSFMIYSYPFYKASKDAFRVDSAIVGESSLAEYSESALISFEDKEVFPSGGVKVTSIKVYGNNRIDEIIYSLASAFVKVGGPLADVFNQATHDLGRSDDVELIEVDDDGFTVTVDDIQVYIGKSSYMEKKDYDIPFDAESKKQEQTGSVGVLYVAYGGQLTAKVYVKYTIDSEFESILAQLYKTGMCVGIKSFDPNIDDLLLAKKIKAMKYPVKVIRSKTVEDIPQATERCDSGIVSRRSVKALLKTVAACERVSRVVKTSLIVKVLAMLIGVVVMVFVSAFGDNAVISSLYIMLYHLFWMLPVFIISKFLA